MDQTICIYCEDPVKLDSIIALAHLPASSYAPFAGRTFDSIGPSLIVTDANVLVAIIAGMFSYI